MIITEELKTKKNVILSATFNVYFQNLNLLSKSITKC
jgi:hypothetical protein